VGKNYLGQLVGGPLRFLMQERAVDIADRENEVISLQFLLTLDKPLQFITAGRALEEAWGDDGDKERDPIERLLNALLPILTPLDIVAILEDWKLFSGMHLHFVA